MGETGAEAMVEVRAPVEGETGAEAMVEVRAQEVQEGAMVLVARAGG